MAWIVELGPASRQHVNSFSFLPLFRHTPYPASEQGEKGDFIRTDKDIIPNLQRIVMHIAPTNPTGRLDHAPLRDNRTSPNTDTRRRDFLA
jgi:hypothetical protein